MKTMSKKNANYEINYVTNTITVSRKFLEEASTLGPAADTMNTLRSLGMKIVEKAPVKRRKGTLTYAKMEKYIKCVENSEAYLAEYNATKEAAKATNNPHAHVWKWFKAHFPNHDKLPEYNENLQIIVTPAECTKEELSA